MNRLWIACSFFAAMMLASCTQEDSMDYNMNIGGKQFLFTFNEESYQAKAQSRAHGVSASAADTVTLGEDMQAEVSIDEEAETLRDLHAAKRGACTRLRVSRYD